MTFPIPSQSPPLGPPPANLSLSSSPTASLTSPLSSLGMLNHATRFWLSPTSQRTMMSFCVCDSLTFLS